MMQCGKGHRQLFFKVVNMTLVTMTSGLNVSRHQGGAHHRSQFVAEVSLLAVIVDFTKYISRGINYFERFSCVMLSSLYITLKLGFYDYSFPS